MKDIYQYQITTPPNHFVRKIIFEIIFFPQTLVFLCLLPYGVNLARLQKKGKYHICLFLRLYTINIRYNYINTIANFGLRAKKKCILICSHNIHVFLYHWKRLFSIALTLHLCNPLKSNSKF